MEGLRGIAVSLVFLVHYSSLIEPWHVSELSKIAHDIGNAGVDLFFVLSGYLIYGTLIDRHQPFGLYIARRVERIYPVFLVVLSIYVALSIAIPSQSKLPDRDVVQTIIENILLLPGLIIDREPIITVAWSLSYEMFFYLAVPVVAASFRDHSAQERLMFICVLSVVLICVIWMLNGPMRIGLFLGGMILSEALKIRAKEMPSGTGILIFIASLTAFHFATGKWTAIVLLTGFPALCYVAFSGDRLTNAILCWKPLRMLGNASYSYYLIHGLTLKAAFASLAFLGFGTKGWPFFLAMIAPMFALTLAPTSVLYWLVEKPISLDRPGWLYSVLTGRKRNPV